MEKTNHIAKYHESYERCQREVNKILFEVMGISHAHTKEIPKGHVDIDVDFVLKNKCGTGKGHLDYHYDTQKTSSSPEIFTSKRTKMKPRGVDPIRAFFEKSERLVSLFAKQLEY